VPAKLGDLLLSRGLITREQLEHALTTQKHAGGRIGMALMALGFTGQDEVAACLGAQFGLPWVRAQALATVPKEVIQRVPRDLAVRYRAVPLKVDEELHVCVTDRVSLGRLDELGFAVGLRVRPYMAMDVAINTALERYYGFRTTQTMPAVPRGSRTS